MFLQRLFLNHSYLTPSFRGLSSLNLQQGPALSPAVHALVLSNNLDASQIFGTGPRGRILKGDVLAFLKNPSSTPQQGIPSSSSSSSSISSSSSSSISSSSSSSSPVILTNKSPSSPNPRTSSSPAPSPSFSDLPLSNVRKIIAQRLQESKRSLPHAYLEHQSRIDALLQLRKQVNVQLAAASAKPTSVNDWFLKAIALALVKNPRINVSLDPKTGDVLQHQSVDISVAVAIPDGLITPILRGAAGKGVARISEEVRALAEKAKAKKLLPEEFQGGSFSVSNLGMFGIATFKAVINPPQTAILAVGGATPRVVPSEVPEREFEVGQFVSFTLSYDVRAIDPDVASQFLEDLNAILENPYQGLL